jgi:hypothetical protein
LRREAGGEEGGGGGEYLGEGSGRCFCWASSLLVGDPFTFRSFKFFFSIRPHVWSRVPLSQG